MDLTIQEAPDHQSPTCSSSLSASLQHPTQDPVSSAPLCSLASSLTNYTPSFSLPTAPKCCPGHSTVDTINGMSATCIPVAGRGALKN